MAATITAVILDSPRAKMFELTVPEGDAVDLQTDLLWGGSGMSNFDDMPDVKIIQNVTPTANNPTVCNDIAIVITNTIFGFTVLKTSVAGAALNGLYRVAMFSREFYEF